MRLLWVAMQGLTNITKNRDSIGKPDFISGAAITCAKYL